MGNVANVIIHLHIGGGEGGKPARCQGLGRDQSFMILCWQAGDQLLIEVVRQSARRPLNRADIETDLPGVTRFDQLEQQGPLFLFKLTAVGAGVEITRARARDVECFQPGFAAVKKDKGFARLGTTYPSGSAW